MPLRSGVSVRLFWAVGGCATALLLTAALAGARGEGSDDEVEPFPIRRVLLPAERVAAAMERARLGVLKQMPLEEFEDLVRRAARNSAALKTEPRIVEAKYRARLEGSDLVGTAAWKVSNPGPAARMLRLDPFNVALQRPARFENRDAFAGDFDGKRPALLLDHPGLRSVSLEWSTHGAANPEGVSFDLNLPAATVATLDLYLPLDHAVVRSPDGYTVTGPLPSETAERQLWHIGFAGNAPLRLTLRRLDRAGRSPAVLTAQVKSRQLLTPDGVEVEYAFEFEALHQDVRELECELDTRLRPVEVAVAELESWELQPATTNAPGSLRVRLREPLRKGTLKIQCFSPLGNGTADVWTSPTARLLKAVPRGETLLIQVHPEVRFADWRPGRYRLVKSATELDGTRVLTLTGGGFEPTSDSPAAAARPQARVEAAGVEYQARQLAWWQVQPRKSSLTCQVTYEALRGRLLQLPLDLPAGWRVERVELDPLGLLRDWEVRQERGVSVLIVELQKPLTPRSGDSDTWTGTGPRTARLLVRLAAEGPAMEWAFPDVAPRGARCREGVLAIDFDEQAYRAKVESAAAPSAPSEDGPWGNQKPDYFYPYYGDPVRGTLRLDPREPRVAVYCGSEVVLASGRAGLIAHITLQPEVGSPDVIDFLASAPPGGKWDWKTVLGNNQVRGFEPVLGAEMAALAGLGARSALDLAVTLQAASRPPGGPRRWRLTLARPLREPVSLDAACEIARGPNGRWEVPLLAAPPPSESENEVTLFLAGADLVQVETEGLRESSVSAVAARGQTGSPWRTFRYSALPARLGLNGRALGADPAGAVVVNRAALTTYVERSGRLMHHFRFQVWNWRQRTLPLRLPAGAELLAAHADGHWVARMPPAAVVEDQVLVELPAFTAGDADRPPLDQDDTAWHTYEIMYILTGSPWRVWTDVPPQPPILPVAPLASRRTWRLPPGVVPLHEHRYRCLPSANRDRSLQDDNLPFPLDGGWPATRRWTMGSAWEAEQRRRIQEAGAALSKALGSKATTLGEVLERLAYEHLVGEPLVLDAEALRQAGLTGHSLPPATTDRAAHPWEAFGLVHVPCPEAPLLTTRQELEDWRGAARLAQNRERAATPLSASLQDAVADAAARGHDDSGRFRLATEWLRGQDEYVRRTGTGAASSLQATLGALHAEYWTEWEPLAGADGEGTFIVVRQDVLPGTALVLAGLLCLIFWRLPERGRLSMLLAWLAAAGLAYFWLPAPVRVLAWWPLLGGAAAALAWYLAWAARKAKQDVGVKPPPIATSLTTGGLLLVVAAGLALARTAVVHGEEPGVQTVFLVREATGDKFAVLAPPELLDRLEAHARRAETPTASAVLVSADYEGKVGGDAAEIKAEFQVYCFGDRPVVLHLPLEGVQLDGETLLDGARVYPGAARPPLAGYTLKIENAATGLHRVNARFRVPVSSTDDARELALTLPGILRSRLTLDLPPGARGPEVLSGDAPTRGRQRVEALPSGARLEADLGRLTAPLRVHWSQARGPTQPAQVQAREAYLWDVRPDAATLTALLRYTVTKGAVSMLALGVPERLEVLSVKAGVASGRGGARLQAWHVTGTGAERRLELEFQDPVGGDVTAVVQLAPRQPLVSGEELPLPVPRAAQSNEGLLACQLTGLQARIQAQGLTIHEREQFALLWRLAVLGDPRFPWLPTHAFSFDRGATGAPALKLDLQIAAPRVRGVQDLAWRVGVEQAEFHATIRLTAPDGDLAVVEWELPPEVTVARLSGPELVSWSQTGGRVQAWLDGPRRGAQLQLVGWVKTPRPAPMPPATATPDEFHLPCVQLLSASVVDNWIRLTGADGLTLEATDRGGLTPLPDPRATAADLAFFSRLPRYHGTFRLTQPASTSEARVLTLAEIRGRQLAFTALVDFQVHRGDLKAATIELRDWPGADLRCEVLEGTAQARRNEGGTAPSWTLELHPGASRRYRFSLAGSLPLEQVGLATAMPSVRVGGASRVERWLAVSGALELQPEAPQGLDELPDGLHSLGVWADPLRRAAGTAWRVTAEDWRLSLRPQTSAPRTPAVHVVLAEQECAVAEGRRWVFESTFWLYHESNTDLTVVLPGRAQLLTAAIDDVAVTPLQPLPGRLWVPLPGRAGSRRLHLRWKLQADEGLERPRMQAPHLDGVDDGPMLWTVHLPAGYRLAPPGTTLGQPARAPAPASATGLDLRRAAGQYQMSTVLAGKPWTGDSAALTSLAAAQRRFYRACRYAEQGLASLGAGGDAGPNGQPLDEWLNTLREQNRQLAHQRGFESLRAEAERQAAAPRRGTGDESEAGTKAVDMTVEAAVVAGRWDHWPDDLLARRGTPLYWQGAPGASGPRLLLTTPHARDVRRALGLSVLWLILLTAIGLATQFPGVRAWLRLFWPEQVTLLGCLVWQTFGPNLLLVFLIALGICGRVVSLVQWLIQWTRRARPLPPSAPAT